MCPRAIDADLLAVHVSATCKGIPTLLFGRGTGRLIVHQVYLLCHLVGIALTVAAGRLETRHFDLHVFLRFKAMAKLCAFSTNAGEHPRKLSSPACPQLSLACLTTGARISHEICERISKKRVLRSCAGFCLDKVKAKKLKRGTKIAITKLLRSYLCTPVFTVKSRLNLR